MRFDYVDLTLSNLADRIIFTFRPREEPIGAGFWHAGHSPPLPATFPDATYAADGPSSV